MVIGARQNFQVSRQNVRFLEKKKKKKNRALPKFLYVNLQ